MIFWRVDYGRTAASSIQTLLQDLESRINFHGIYETDILNANDFNIFFWKFTNH